MTRAVLASCVSVAALAAVARLDPRVAVAARPDAPVASAARTDIPVSVASPDGKTAISLWVEPGGRLSWRARRNGHDVIEASPLGIVVDGVHLGQGAAIESAHSYNVDERYAWRGVHAEAINRANGARIVTGHTASATRYVIDVRVFDDGVAFRIEVPGSGRRVPDAAAGFRLPRGTLVWFHRLRDHYEGTYERWTIEDLREGEWAAPPVTLKLPESRGYAAIMEADLRDYPGMALQADGANGLLERLAHSHPPGYPFTLRFGEEEARRLAVAASIDGPIRTPWRVVLIGADLNTLVNSDVVHNLCPPPDPRYFPQGIRTAWLRPGRAVWRYLDGGENTFDGIKEFSRLAGELGFEHHVVEGIWQRWTEDQLRELVEYSKARNVGIWVWRHRRTLAAPEERRTLFASLQRAGVAGVKVDFLDHEAKEVVDLYRAILRDAAEFRLMINFHGANKPAGEPRSWPNELTREAIYGLEHRRAEAWAAFNTTFPFTRLLAGHADYTPVVFGERRRETSWAHQIASAAILTSPLLVYGAHPATLLASPAVEMIRSIPSVWDETIVLPSSEIGELALFARRSGASWFVAAMNGSSARTVALDLSFLAGVRYDVLTVRDRMGDAATVEVERTSAVRTDRMEIPMRAGGGFVVRLTPADASRDRGR
ncbi:MAG TPA: glycoside hydrolase family 97 N-terminal domain-containing protein [Vicinamibacterales bacterium]|nr:glycoside hydrolase family 97 N-terminal domain-containing protein [Vicinamibacterales bacterium]